MIHATLGRYRDMYDEPRDVVERIASLDEPARTRERSFCCGAGGGRVFLGEEEGKRVNIERAEQLVSTGAPVIGAACPFCNTMFRDALAQIAPAWSEIAGYCANRRRVPCQKRVHRTCVKALSAFRCVSVLCYTRQVHMKEKDSKASAGDEACSGRSV